MRKRIVVCVFVVFVGLGLAAEEGPFADPEALVTGVYGAVSGSFAEQPDWDFIRSHFDPKALIVLRSSREESTVHDVDGFIKDFTDFYGRIAEAEGFKETVVSVRSLVYGNMAHVYVVYEAQILGDDRPPQRGLDSWHLVKNDGRWWVVSIVNDSEPASGPIPKEAFAD
jgi:hypothetical protein